VLTDEKIDESNVNLMDIAREGIEGGDVLDWEVTATRKLSKREMAQELVTMGSEANFMLGEDGWKYGLDSGDEVQIDTGDNELGPSVIIATIEYHDDSVTIVTNEGKRIDCLVSEIC